MQTLIVGIDVGNETHYVRVFDWQNYEYTKKPLEFSNIEAGIQAFKAWMEDMAGKHGKTAVILSMELIGHCWFALGRFLQDSGMRTVHVNPHHVKKSKEMDDNNPNKNDRKAPGIGGKTQCRKQRGAGVARMELRNLLEDTDV